MNVYDEFVFNLSKKRETIDFNIDKYIKSKYGGEILDLIQYITKHGKRLRGLLLTIASEAYKGNVSKTENLAVSAELGHSASLVHDDIMDRARERRGAESFWAKYGLERGVILPHILISESLNIARNEGEEFVNIGISTWQKAAYGQYLDFIAEDEKNHHKLDYLNVIDLKSGSLFEGAVEISANIVKGSKLFIEEAKKFGKALGISYQLSDDFIGAMLSEEGGGSNKLFKTYLLKSGIDVFDKDKTFKFVLNFVKKQFNQLNKNKEFVLTDYLRYFLIYSIVEIFRETNEYVSQVKEELENILI
jgi:geranylgeranyl pyrophosphate synthase